MNKFIKKIVAAFTAVAVTASAGIFSASAESVTYEVSTDSDNLVSIMKSYCFIALEELDVSGHQHGSAIAARIVKNPRPEGGINIESELCLRNEYGASTTYIQSFEQLNGMVKIGYGKDTLRIGENYTIRTNGSEKFVVCSYGGCEHKVENAGTVIADTATSKYMDLNNLKRSFEAYNKQLAETPAAGTVTVSGQTYSVDAADGAVYYNINSSNYGSINADSIINFPAGSTAILVLNIDMNGISEWNRKPFVLTEGGVNVTSDESVYNHETANRIYYNFYDSSKTDKQYTGAINMTEKGWGTVIAPSASVTVGSNFCGVLVASSVTARGETHFVGAYKPVTPVLPTAPTPILPSECKIGIEFDKVDSSNGCALEGALFGIYSENTCSGTPLFEKASDVSGIVRFEDIPAGTYYLKEIQPPTGFNRNETIYSVEVVFDSFGNGTVTFEGGKTMLTVPNDPITAVVPTPPTPPVQPDPPTPPVQPEPPTPPTPPVQPEPSETTTKATTPTTPPTQKPTTTVDEGGTTTTTYKWNRPSHGRLTTPATTTTVDEGGNAPSGTTVTTTAGKNTTSKKKSDATSETTKRDKNDKKDETTATDKTTKTTADKTTATISEKDKPETTKTDITDTTRPPEEKSDFPEDDIIDNDMSDDSDDDAPSQTTGDTNDNDLNIVVTNNPDNSTGIDFSTDSAFSSEDNPYTGVENAAGLAIVFGELALAAAILKKKK